MVKFNRSFIDPALKNLIESGNVALDRDQAYNELIRSQSERNVLNGKAHLIFRSNLGIGIKFFLVLLGFGFFVVLLAYAANFILNKYGSEEPLNNFGLPETINDNLVLIQKLDDLSVALENFIVSSSEPASEPIHTSPFSIPALQFDVQSSNCENNFSFSEQCSGSAAFDGGISYNGTWLFGLPEGKGTVSFPDGSSFEGTWENGQLVSIVSRVEYNGDQAVDNLFFSLPSQNIDDTSLRCFNNASYISTCDDEYEYPNGSIYDGEWRNGSPNGVGRLTFKEGGAVDGNWSNGELISLNDRFVPVTSTIRSVTQFEQVEGTDINPLFIDIVVGHRFETSSADTWISAYCYLTIEDGTDRLQVSLSNFETFDSALEKYPYMFSRRYSRAEFELAQARCPYRRVGFN